MGARRRGREIALQIIYLTDITKMPLEKALNGVTKGDYLEEHIYAFAKNLSEGVAQHQNQLDTLIKKHTKNWEIGRMAALDRNILRLGTYELLFELDTPVSVIIDEAVEIAKTFSTEESGKFVNGILDKIKGERTESLPEENGKRKIKKEN